MARSGKLKPGDPVVVVGEVTEIKATGGNHRRLWQMDVEEGWGFTRLNHERGKDESPEDELDALVEGQRQVTCLFLKRIVPAGVEEGRKCTLKGKFLKLIPTANVPFLVECGLAVEGP